MDTLLLKDILQYRKIYYLLVASVFVIASCTSTNHVYKLYPGPVKPDSEVVLLQFGSGISDVKIDGMQVRRSDYQLIKLLPGEHEVQWGAIFVVSVLTEPDGFDQADKTSTVQLQAGHTYTLHKDRTTGHDYKMYLWLTDDTTGEVVAGEKKP